MKKVIDGKMYNTETATALAEADNPTAGRNNFRWWTETLFRSPKGQLFLAGEGGPMSRWSQLAVGGGSTGGEGLALLTVGEARDWAERWLDADQYTDIFQAEAG